mgnify:CR=1 FL=1
MDYKAEIIRMVEAIQAQTALKKIHKFVRMIYNGMCNRVKENRP